MGFTAVKNSICPRVIIASFHVLHFRSQWGLHFLCFWLTVLLYDFLNASSASNFKTNPGNLFPRHFLQTPVERDCITFLEKAEECLPVICILDQCGVTVRRRGGSRMGGGGVVVGAFSNSDKELGVANSLFLIVSHHGQWLQFGQWSAPPLPSHYIWGLGHKHPSRVPNVPLRTTQQNLQ